MRLGTRAKKPHPEPANKPQKSRAPHQPSVARGQQTDYCVCTALLMTRLGMGKHSLAIKGATTHGAAVMLVTVLAPDVMVPKTA